MLDLITGLPGNAKTAFTISHVKAWSERENRPVYYSGIAGLTLPWTEIEPEKWMECPPGSIIVIDECQRIFRNRSINAAAPKYVTDLETHRHLGVDIVFITQHPMLIDPALRRLVGRHRHLVRIWGMEASTIHEWNAVKEGCDKPAMRKDSEKRKWVFDKSVYPLYRSAEMHTMKRSIPMRFKLLLLVPLVVIAAGWFVWYLLVKKPQDKAIAAREHTGQVSPSGASVGSASASGSDGRDKVTDPVADAKQYVFEQTPRVVGLPQTAPKYDELTKPTSVPVPAACVQRASGCKCYTQQGTSLDVGNQICRDIVKNGFFEEFDPDGGKHDRRLNMADSTVAAVSPAAVVVADSSGSLGSLVPPAPPVEEAPVQRVTSVTAPPAPPSTPKPPVAPPKPPAKG